ncbi:hypothetical protein [Amycolatopsis saalfeldensis]|uniref:Uncharacterized protein n=1 Tax=Amycolatopsis saalfeldensis TaxID=394193 RepID=A0A1H8YMI6_9PSEU|nr:hypothetical protein [Amycolatopsis saalfeldensis]SEP53369.1 hypothetical protein SAMN04489732_12693 [Amycolatopsis saalfeldensis]
MVPACLDCHELKDQYNLRNWPHADLAAAWYSILTCLEHEGFPDGDELAHLRMTDWWEEQPDSSDEAVLARWSELQPLSRVLYAKARAEKERHKRALSEDAILIGIGPQIELEAEAIAPAAALNGKPQVKATSEG